jgi:hypothetical protein
VPSGSTPRVYNVAMIFDAASEGTDVIRGMLIVGLIFLAVIVLGELTHWANHRRRVRSRARSQY